MHRDLKELLADAHGEARFVAVVFLDVRGFSAFPWNESSETAEFLRCAYSRILGDYFADASFFKPTGDGLLVIFDYQRGTLPEVVRNVVDTSLRLVDDFATITEAEQMVNFPVPGDLGIGIARGAATCLVSGEKTLDYSGRPLNLASRLMDVARPSGVVFDDSLGCELVGDEMMARFAPEDVYLKSLAEEEPIRAYCTADRTVVPEVNRFPINRYRRRTEKVEVLTMKDLAQRSLYSHRLTQAPAKTDDIVVYLQYPDVTTSGRRHPSIHRTKRIEATHVERLGEHFAQVDYRSEVAFLKKARVKSTWRIKLTPEYSVRGT